MSLSGFATIGHSNRPLDEVEAMLAAAKVDLVIDVRAFPRSRRNPAFNIDSLPAHLKAQSIDYIHMAALGGRRPRQPDVPPEVNALWDVEAFHNYADYALGETFSEAFSELLRHGAGRRPALMCAEAMWWRCHRRIIADYLVLNGHPVDHLMTPGRTTAAVATPGSLLRDDGKVVYPAEAPLLTLADRS